MISNGKRPKEPGKARAAFRPAKTARSRKRQDSNPKSQSVSFGAYPDEIERWKKAAKEADRTLSWWIRSRLLAMDRLDLHPPAPEPLETAVASDS